MARAINNWDAASTGLSPFFFIYSYHIDPIILDERLSKIILICSEAARQAFVDHLREATDWAQSAIAIA